MAYAAIVTRLKNVRPHSNADKVQLATCQGNQVVIGLDSLEDHLGVYFPSDGQLSDEFCKANNLYRDADLNARPKESGGMFDANRRVRAQRFRGEISDGFWVPLHYFGFIQVTGLDVEGFEFTEWKGVPICNKYINPATLKIARENQGKKAKVSRSSVMFKEHFDTGHFGKNIHEFQKGQHIVITEKLHGCVKWDTIVETLEKGPMTIKAIVDGKLDVKIKALDTETNEIVYVPIDDYYTIQDEGDWYEIELENGKTITITGNNPVWLPELNCYRNVEDLKGDEILLID